MKVVYSENCLLHNPEFETLSGRRVPYLESPDRYLAIKRALSSPECSSIFEFFEPDEALNVEDAILSVHTNDYLDYMKNAYTNWVSEGGDKAAVIPDTFFHHKLNHLNKTVDIRRLSAIANAGFYCFDLSTPITADTYASALAAVKTTLTACDILGKDKGERGVFALTRPPGHHAGASLCGGYCYFNNAAIAARFLQSTIPHPQKVAILDIDYHHGNGTQEMFYDDPSVLYVSLHANPDYPYFTGYADEVGYGNGEGFNLNIPLPTGTTGNSEYCIALNKALEMIASYAPIFLIVSLGVDTYKDDPICDFKLTSEGYKQIGASIASLDMPTVFIMEGGYHLSELGNNVRAVLEAFVSVAR